MYLQRAVYDGVNAILCKWSLYVDTELDVENPVFCTEQMLSG